MLSRFMHNSSAAINLPYPVLEFSPTDAARCYFLTRFLLTRFHIKIMALETPAGVKNPTAPKFSWDYDVPEIPFWYPYAILHTYQHRTNKRPGQT